MADIAISSAPSGADLAAVGKSGRATKQDGGDGKGFLDALTSSLGNGRKPDADAEGDADTADAATGTTPDPAVDLGTTVPVDDAGINPGTDMIDPSLANLANLATLTKGAKPSVASQFPQALGTDTLPKSLTDPQQAVPGDDATSVEKDEMPETVGDADLAQVPDQADDIAQQLADALAGDQPVRKEADDKTETSAVKSGKVSSSSDDGKQLPTQGAQPGSAVSDVLSLLNAPQGAANAIAAADVKTQAEPSQPLGKVTDAAAKTVTADAQDGDAVLPGTVGDDPVAQTFRLTRADGRGGSLDLSVGKGTDDAAHADVKASGSGNVETVTVLDSRRYLGLAANTNSALVTATLAGDKDWAAAMQPSSTLANAASWTSTGKVVNTLKIQLNPDNLGQVTATMRLSGDQLSVDLKVSTGDAYRQLHADQSHMVDALRAQGYQVDSITVSLAASGDQSSDGNRQSSFQGQSQQQSLMNQGQGGDARSRGQQYSGQQANGNDGNGGAGERGTEDGTGGSARRLRSGDVYL
ncbi:flagellar hook-length control protein FliK [Rhizobium sp. BK602]|uniref:flagellar hook-length control protein FliK n=1 Tax=Rhizobium sp. BK602 TaxID=2586986 RepID=UPI00161DFCA4|nr:flagellar hook-length control protein FliK [Rhizobium sp. BK602]MBB3608311.1 chemotaxis protein MotD [Rhizobium sp. BK602]